MGSHPSYLCTTTNHCPWTVLILATTTTKLSEGEIAGLEIDVGTTIKNIVVVAIGQKGQMYAMIEEAMNMITNRNVDFVMADLVGI